MRATLGLVAVISLAGCDLVFGLDRGSDAVAVYDMDALAGGVLHDDSGHGHDGTCVSCPATGPGVREGALVFDGKTNEIVVPSAPAFVPLDALTVAVWFRLDDLPAQTPCLVGKLFAGRSDANSWQLCILGDGRPALYANEVGGGAAVFGQSPIAVGEWHHFALRWDGSTLQLVIDGAKANQEVAALLFDDGDLTIGADDNDGVLEDYFAGALDDLEIYDRALTSEELSALAARSARTIAHHMPPSENPEQTSSVQ